MRRLKEYDFGGHYAFCENKQIIFSYKGKISNNIIQGIVTILEERLADHNVADSSVREMISVIIELTQNIQHYSLHKKTNQGHEYGYGMIVVRKVEEGFHISAGNPVSREKGKELIRHFNQLKKLDQKNLKEMYLEKLKVDRKTAADRAGIGLIHILRKSNSQMGVKLYQLDETNVLLTFSVLVS